MSRGPIPDKPRQRPSTPDVIAAAKAYYQQPGNICGGSLHIVLDDHNLEDCHIIYCRDYAKDRGDDDGVILAQLLLAMTGTQRRAVARAV